MKALIELFNNIVNSINYSTEEVYDTNSVNPDIPESAIKYIF